MGENYFKTLYDIDVRSKTKKKNNKDDLAYLSWSSCWAEVKKVYPNATYNIHRFGENHLPYIYDDATGYMVSTDVTIEGVTHEMQLPVLNGANKAMKKEPYTYTVTYKEKVTDKTVEAATMFDINTAIMRCLVKNCAVHGLGLYLYEGSDLPDEVRDVSNLQKELMELINKKSVLSDEAKEKVVKTCKDADEDANGDPRLIFDSDKLKELRKKLLAIRK
jgi:hypothetical protein